jgi:hypothetical protein
VVAIVISLVIALVGLYFGVTQDAEMATMGWLFLVVGLVGLAANLYLRGRGVGAPRRRP